MVSPFGAASISMQPKQFRKECCIQKATGHGHLYGLKSEVPSEQGNQSAVRDLSGKQIRAGRGSPG